MSMYPEDSRQNRRRNQNSTSITPPHHHHHNIFQVVSVPYLCSQTYVYLYPITV